ncbi:MAG: hypothetical protein R3F21_05360 [Myxococcota bacterium]
MDRDHALRTSRSSFSCEFSIVLRAVLMLALTGLAFACKTVPIKPATAIAVPQGLTQTQVRVAIIAAVLDQPVPENLTKREEMADRALGVALWPFYRSVNPRRDGEWFFESSSEDSVTASFQRNTHLLRVLIAFDAAAARVSIVDADNLRYTESRIHKAVPKWISDLEIRIRRSFSQMQAAIETQGILPASKDSLID